MARVGVNQRDLCQASWALWKGHPQAVVPGQPCSDTFNLASRKGISLGGGRRESMDR